ncbi:hypothetical protein ACOMHN_062237 [Nucella lapillus]
MNRAQNMSYVTLCTISNGSCDVSIEEEGNGGWVDLFKPPVFSRDGRSYFWPLPQRHANHDHFLNLARVRIKSGQSLDIKTFLTLTAWDVTDVLAYDDDREIVYFLGTGGDPRKRHLYSVSVPSRRVVCVTCGVAPGRCDYVSASFSLSAAFFLLACLGPALPHYSLRSPQETAELRRMENNTAFAERVSTRAMPRVQHIQVELDSQHKMMPVVFQRWGETASTVPCSKCLWCFRDDACGILEMWGGVSEMWGGVSEMWGGVSEMWGKLLLPPTLNERQNILYPLLVSVYGGPGTQQVTLQYSIKWETYLAGGRGVVVLFVDGRGTGGRGQQWLHQLYKRLGTVEVDDTITATRFMSKKPYIDSDKIAIWGWSYGGYLTNSVLGRGTGLVRCAVSVAPVTDWIYYMSLTGYTTVSLTGYTTVSLTGYTTVSLTGYTTVSLTGYTTVSLTGYTTVSLTGYATEANVSQYVDNFKKSRLLLIHGTGDDNVHFQHSAQLMKAMVDSDVYFRTMVYPDKHHGLLGGNTRPHLFNTMNDFLTECYDGVSQKFGHSLARPAEGEEEERK